MAMSADFGIHVCWFGIIGMDFSTPCSMRAAAARPDRPTTGAAGITYAHVLHEQTAKTTARREAMLLQRKSCSELALES